jgi:hypothetical protein
LTYRPIESSSPGTSSLMKRPSLLLNAMVLVLRRTEFLEDDTTDAVPAPIGPLHKYLPAGTPPSASDATNAPAGPSAAVPGAPPESPEDTDDPPMPALYIPPALRASGTPTAPRAAVRSPSSAQRAATELTDAPGGVSLRLLYVPPALRASSTSSALSAGFPAPPQAPRGPPPGFPPLRPARDFTYHYSRRPRPPSAAPAPAVPAAPAPAAPAAPAPTSVAAAPLPKGAVAVPPVANQHPMGTRSKSGFRMPTAYHVVPLSPVPKTFRSALADPNWRAAMEEHSALLQNHTWDLVPRPPQANVVTGKWIFKHKL